MGQYNFSIDVENGKINIETPKGLNVVLDDTNEEVIINGSDGSIKIKPSKTEIINNEINLGGSSYPVALGSVVDNLITAYNNHEHLDSDDNSTDSPTSNFSENPNSETVFVDS